MTNSRTVWMAAGLAVGLIVGLNMAGIWPQIPVHAVATHGQDNFAIATGPLDDNVEAIFVLDAVTGELKAASMNVQSRRFNTWYDYNVSRDLPVTGSKNAQYRMVTGYTNIRQVPAAGQLGRTVVYIAEATTGQVAAYGVPWVPGRYTSPIPLKLNLLLLDRWQFREVPVRELQP
jgi:hypothetical protein